MRPFDVITFGCYGTLASSRRRTGLCVPSHSCQRLTQSPPIRSSVCHQPLLRSQMAFNSSWV